MGLLPRASLPVPGTRRGVSQARLDNAHQLGQQYGNYVWRGAARPAAQDGVWESGRRIDSAIYCVLVGSDEDKYPGPPSLHRQPQTSMRRGELLSEATGEEEDVQARDIGYLDRVGNARGGIGARAVFKGWPSMLEVESFLAGMGVRMDEVRDWRYGPWEARASSPSS